MPFYAGCQPKLGGTVRGFLNPDRKQETETAAGYVTYSHCAVPSGIDFPPSCRRDTIVDMENLGLAAALDGAWRVLRITDAGSDATFHDDDKDHSDARPTPTFLWFTDQTIVAGDGVAAWDMPCRILGSSAHHEIDISRTDRREPWVQRCIIEVIEDTLRIRGAAAATMPRPKEFTSTVENGQVLYLAERCHEPLPK